MKVSAKAGYALRADRDRRQRPFPLKAERIADRQAIPPTFLHEIRHELRMAGLIRT
jgi:DNA-binding IscR family transcriptional regulator